MHTHRHSSPIALSFSQLHCVLINTWHCSLFQPTTLYLLTHDIALSFSQLHNVTKLHYFLQVKTANVIHLFSSSGGGLLVNLLYLFHFNSIQYMKNGHQATDQTLAIQPEPPKQLTRPRPHSLNHPSNWLDPGHTAQATDFRPWPHSLNHPSNWLDPGHTAQATDLDPGHTAWTKQLTWYTWYSSRRPRT